MCDCSQWLCTCEHVLCFFQGRLELESPHWLTHCSILILKSLNPHTFVHALDLELRHTNSRKVMFAWNWPLWIQWDLATRSIKKRGMWGFLFVCFLSCIRQTLFQGGNFVFFLLSCSFIFCWDNTRFWFPDGVFSFLSLPILQCFVVIDKMVFFCRVVVFL